MAAERHKVWHGGENVVAYGRSTGRMYHSELKLFSELPAMNRIYDEDQLPLKMGFPFFVEKLVSLP